MNHYAMEVLVHEQIAARRRDGERNRLAHAETARRPRVAWVAARLAWLLTRSH